MKKMLAGGILVLVLLPTFAFAQEERFNSIRNIQEAVREKTPEFIKKSFSFTKNKLESFRTGLLEKIEARKNETRSKLDDTEIQVPKNEGAKTGDAAEEIQKEVDGIMGELQGAFRYLEVFLLIILIFILSIKIIFYGILVFLLLLLSRFFWYRFY